MTLFSPLVDVIPDGHAVLQAVVGEHALELGHGVAQDGHEDRLRAEDVPHGGAVPPGVEAADVIAAGGPPQRLVPRHQLLVRPVRWAQIMFCQVKDRDPDRFREACKDLNHIVGARRQIIIIAKSLLW